MVDLLKNDLIAQTKLKYLRHYIYTINKALDEENITLEKLRAISQLSTDKTNLFKQKLADESIEIAEKDEPLFEDFKAFAAILEPKATLFSQDREEELGIILGDDEEQSLDQALLTFDEEQVDYLSLKPLAVSNIDTINTYLNDMASIGLLFAPHLSIKEEAQGIEKTGLDNVAFQHSKVQWLQQRPVRIHAFDVDAAHHVGILEKFLAKQLKLNEWLTDNDIEREIKHLRKKDADVPAITVCRFNIEDMGMALHFAREANKNSDTPYHIPFILNLGESNHASLNDRGTHWVRAVVTVDPATIPPQVSVDYTDSLKLHPATINKVKQTLQKAINYRTQIGRLGAGQKVRVYQAFPEVDSPIIKAVGSAEQHDGYTCGYRAIKGIISDLVDKGIVVRDNHEELLACETPQDFTDVIYQDLISGQVVDSKTYEKLSVNRQGLYTKLDDAIEYSEYSIDSDTILGELHRLRHGLVTSKIASDSKQQDTTAEQLKLLAEQYKVQKQLGTDPTIIAIAKSDETESTIDLEQIITEVKKNASCNDEAIIISLLKAINGNDTITKLNLNNIDESLIPTFKRFLDANTTLTTINIDCDNEDLKAQAKAIAVRNDYLQNNHMQGTKNPWQSFFKHLIFDVPQQQASFCQLPEDQANNATIRRQFLQFLQDSDAEIKRNSPYIGIDLSHDAIFDAVDSQEITLPFNCFHLTVTNDKQLKESVLPFIQKMPADQVNLTLDEEVSDEAIAELITTLQKKPDFISQIRIERKTPLTNKIEQDLQLFYNEVEGRRRHKVDSPTKSTKSQSVTKPTGPIGRAMLGQMGNLATEIQVQQQQQQQQQQQVQSSSEMEAEEDETDISQEAYAFFESDEELITRDNIADKLDEFINARTVLAATQCWDLITGANSGAFKHSIKKITVSAAKKLIDSLEECQYGLNLDNLPQGFYVAEKEGDIVLAYDGLNPIINVNESPLTLQLTKIPQAQSWLGDMRQFLTESQCKALYNKLYPAPRFLKSDTRPPIEECVANFFFIADDTKCLSSNDYKTILQAVLSAQDHDDIARKIEQIFTSPDELSTANYRAVFEAIYSGKQLQLSDFLDKLNTLKTTRPDYFPSFKHCFIDTCSNWNALLGEKAMQSLSVISRYSGKKLLWWQNLTEQHAENSAIKKNHPDISEVTNRWQDLTHAQQGFDYFWEEAKDLGFEPTDAKFPLRNVANMHVGLDRLLTILRNAKDIDEQMSNLHHLSLDALGAYYASRYEGFRLVTAKMGLASSNILKEEYTAPDCQYRLNKTKLSSILTDTYSDEKQIIALFLRYIASYNHRQPMANYLAIINHVIEQPFYSEVNADLLCGRTIPAQLFSILATLTTGKKNIAFTLDDISNLCTALGLENFKRDDSKNATLFQKLMDIDFCLVQKLHPSFAELTKLLASKDFKQSRNTRTFQAFEPIYYKQNIKKDDDRIQADRIHHKNLIKGMAKFSSQQHKNFEWLQTRLLVFSNLGETNSVHKEFCYFNEDRLLIAKLASVFACIAAANKPLDEATAETTKEAIKASFEALTAIDKKHLNLANNIINDLANYGLHANQDLPPIKEILSKHRNELEALLSTEELKVILKDEEVFAKITEEQLAANLDIKEFKRLAKSKINELTTIELATAYTSASTGEFAAKLKLIELLTIQQIINLLTKYKLLEQLGEQLETEADKLKIIQDLESTEIIDDLTIEQISEFLPRDQLITQLNKNQLIIAIKKHEKKELKQLFSIQDIVDALDNGRLFNIIPDDKCPGIFADKAPHVANFYQQLVELHKKDKSRSDNLVRALKKIDISIKNPIPTLEELADQVTELASTNAFYERLSAIYKKDPVLAHQVVEVLGKIDLTNSENLPSLEQLTTVLATIEKDYDKSLTDLKTYIAETLKVLEVDGIEYELDIEEPDQHTAQVNPHAVLAKHMGAIVEELRKLFDNKLLKPLLKQAGLDESFLEQLNSANGATILIDNLSKFEELKSEFKEAKRNNPLVNLVSLDSLLSPIQTALSNVYDNLLDNTKSEFKDSGQQICALLKSLQHPLKSMDFDAFCDKEKGYVTELGYLSTTIDNLKKLQRGWRDDFPVFINALVEQQVQLKKYTIAQFGDLLALVVADYPKTKKLPAKALAKLLALGPEKSNQVLGVLLDSEEDTLKYPLSVQSFEKVTNLASLESIKSTDIRSLLNEHHDKPYFDAVLDLANTADADLAKIKDTISKLKKLDDESISILCQNQLEDFHAISTELLECDEDKQQIIFQILQKAIGNTAKDKNLTRKDKTALIAALNKKSPEELEQILNLYATNVSPDVATLTAGLDNLPNLIKQYDINPNGIHDNDAAYYEDQSFSSYVEKLIDLNYERVLLRSERQVLYKHLLYINYLGHQQFPDDKKLPIKDRPRAEILELIEHRRQLLNNPEITPAERTKAQLEVIALLREVMFRTTGKQARPNQLLFLVTAMLKGENFIGQIPTGQGKSLTSAMQAALKSIEGQTVDVCTSTKELANEGLSDYGQFYDYLKIPTKLIAADSEINDYQAGAIHYSSLSELALYRSKMVLRGKKFPQKFESCLIIDEVDYSAFDDSTEYRVATDIDKVTHVGVNPYEWMYAIIIDYVDENIKQGLLLSDEDFLKAAKKRIAEMAQGKQQKQGLASLVASGQYDKRLKMWLTAAATTHQLINFEEVHSDTGETPKKVRFRVIQEEKDINGETRVISKACIVEGGQMHAKAQFSHGVQQFLEMRLRTKYQAKIDKKSMPDFAIPTEKNCIMALNSRLMFENYTQRYGLSGTAIGSRDETFELQTKYGFKIVDIPPHVPSKRQVLKPILTNPKLLDDTNNENADHIKRIVSEVIRHIKESPAGKCPPVLIHCSDKAIGQQISQMLEKEISKQSKAFQAKLTTTVDPKIYKDDERGRNLITEKKSAIKEFYGSECEKEKDKLEQARQYRAQAGEPGVITISSVFGRGTDITPEHAQGLYTIQTYVDTEAYSSEDLVRAKTQKFGRAARDTMQGRARLIIKRSEFSPVADTKTLKRLKPSIDKVDHLIHLLNQQRNTSRVEQRQQREAISTVKHYFQQRVIRLIREFPAEKEVITAAWRVFLEKIDNYLKNPDNKDIIDGLIAFTLMTWQQDFVKFELGGDKCGKYINVNPLKKAEELRHLVDLKQPCLNKHYVAYQERLKLRKTTADVVYCEMNSGELREEVVFRKVSNIFIHDIKKDKRLNKAIRDSKVSNGLIGNENIDKTNLETLIASLLHVRYKAFRDDNKGLFQRANKQLDRIVYWCHEFSNDDVQKQAVKTAFKKHVAGLFNHTSNKQARKFAYVTQLHREMQRHGIESTDDPMKHNDKCLSTLQWEGYRNKDKNITHIGLKANAVKQLLTYTNNWRKYFWVSSDRKTVVENLIGSFGDVKQINESNATAILDKIHAARIKLLKKDVEKSRVLAAGLSGRLNGILNNLEEQVIAILPEHRQNIYDCQAKHALTVIQELSKKNNKGKSILSDELLELIKKSNIESNASADKCYQHLLELDKKLNLHLAKEGKKASSEFRIMSRYCQSQLNKLKGLSSKGARSRERGYPETFYECMAKEAFQYIDVQAKSKKSFISPRITKDLESIIYRDYAVKVNHIFHMDPNGVQESTFYKFVNQPGVFYALLERLEEQVVESSGKNVRLKFEKIKFEISEKFDKGFKLTVNLSHQWQEGTVTFHFNCDNRQVYCESNINEIKPEKVMSSVGSPPIDKKITEAASKVIHEVDAMLQDEDWKELAKEWKRDVGSQQYIETAVVSKQAVFQGLFQKYGKGMNETAFKNECARLLGNV